MDVGRPQRAVGTRDSGRGRGLRLAPVWGTALALALLWAPPAAAAADLTCERIPQLLSAYFQKHIRYGYLNAELRSRALEAYLERLDPSRTLYLASEIDSLREELTGIFHEIYSGECERLEKLQSDLVTRYERMEGEVRASVSRDDWKLDPEMRLIIDPETRGHPVDEEARKRLVDKLVHFQMSNYLSGEMELAEAKRRLVHRYELMTKRAREIEREDVYATFLDAFATSLDPHSHYFSAEQLEDFEIEMRLSLDGIGVALSSRDGYSVVEKIIPGGATDKLGVLRPKDKVIAVAQADGDWVDIIDMDLRDVVRLIRGKRGTEVRLRVLRQTDKTETLTVSIVRDKIDLEERSAKLHIETVGEGEDALRLAVIDLPSFYGDRNPVKRQSSRDLRQLLDEVKQAKVDGLLLDLSRNGGGLLETAVEIAGLFIDKGGVVAVKGTDAGVQWLSDRDPSVLYGGPMVVLTSRISASASEIVAGALKDYRRAVIVGDDHTFGKGTVQSMVPLPPGLGALKVTTAMFFRPGGESTQHAGVASHIRVPSLTGAEDLGERHQDYSLPSERIQAAASVAKTKRERGWKQTEPEWIEELSRRSAQRVLESETFTELAGRIAEVGERNGVIQLSDLLEEREEQRAAGDAAVSVPKAAEEAASGDDDDDPGETPQREEALAILADLVRLQQDG